MIESRMARSGAEISFTRRRASALLAAGALAPALAHAQSEPPELAADRIFGGWLRSQGAPGGVVGVVRSGQLLVAKGYGVRSLDNPVPLDPDTLYCIASVTKAITAFAVLLLCDEGRLALDQPAARYLPDLPPQWAGVTIRQFLCHVSGIPADGLIRRAHWEGSMAAAARLGAGEPGQRTRYNNFNYVVAGRLVEVASARAYPAFVQDRIFTPLGMTRSRIGEAYDYNRATGYQRSYGSLIEPPLWPEAGPQYDAAGRGFSTLNDLLAFLGAIREGRLLSQEAQADMVRPYGPAQRGTCGWFAKVAGGVPFTEKLGRLSGYSADVEFDARGDAIVMLWNLQASLDRSNRPRAALRQALLGIGLGEPDSPYPSVEDEHDG